MRKILSASECLTVKRNEQLREKLKLIMWEAIVELEKVLFRVNLKPIWSLRQSILKVAEIKQCKEVEPLGQYFDTLFAKLSTDQETSLSYLMQPATMKLLEIRKVVPKR